LIQKFISKLSKKEQRIFNWAIIVVLLASFDQLFIGPAIHKLQALESQIETQKNSIVRDLKFMSYKDKILTESNLYKSYFTKKAADGDVVNANFLRTVEKLATKANVNLVKSNPTETKQFRRYTEYYANLDCVGKLNDLITFMHSINSTGELLKIVRLNMTPKRGSEEEEVNASMTIVKLVMLPNISGVVSR